MDEDDDLSSPGAASPAHGGTVHPHAFVRLCRAECHGRRDAERRQVCGLAKLNEAMLALVEKELLGIDSLKRAAAQQQRALEHSRKRLSNEQTRHRVRIDDDWLRGYERLLYVDFVDGARRVRQRAVACVWGVCVCVCVCVFLFWGGCSRGGLQGRETRQAHGSAHYAVVHLQNYPRSRAVQQSLFR
eukprot:TRINITY_DN1772_c1_g1_i1.p1 TRINITY_DN1772_c1_g1~~TRINITY_DN1772_c1_g1_i1.p1  ORF type:complete len:187 (+),score=49.58 TRINITY_DN1772_c1_g1_i1:181-741(+)